MQCALSIAGSDPTGGAGLQADLQVFSAHGVHGAGVVTALTLQDSAGVHGVMPVFPSVALDQLRVLLADITPAAVKIGMLAPDDVAPLGPLGRVAEWLFLDRYLHRLLEERGRGIKEACEGGA